MGNDYNIYLRNETSSSNGGDVKETSVKSLKSAGVNKKTSLPKTPLQMLKSETNDAITAFKGEGIEMLGKAAIVVAVGIEIAKLTDKAIATTLPIMASATGDYSGSIAYSNFKYNLNKVFHPISAIISYTQMRVEIDNANKRKAQERALLGNSSYNYYGWNGRTV